MAGFGENSLNTIVRNNAFEQIGSYILFCCYTMTEDLLTNCKDIPNDENKIRNYLLENYLDDNLVRRQNNMLMFHFESEIPENYDDTSLTYEGRVDIRVVNQNDWFMDGAATYFVECKRLDGNKHLNDEYVQNGIKRFVVSPPHYVSYYDKNFMLGFIVKRVDIDANVKKIELIQQSDNQIQELCGLIKKGAGSVNAYDCKYSMDGKVIELRHMFTDFSDSIRKK